MSRTPADSVAPYHVLLTRGLFFFFGCIAVSWGVVVLPIVWQQSSAVRVAERVIAGDRFKSEILSEQLASLTNSENPALCRPIAFQSAAIIQLRITESVAGGMEKGNEQLGPLDNAVRNSLSCAPADPFLWLILYAVQNAKNGFTPDNLNYLRMSYALGPNEGWILEKRNPLAIAELGVLSADLTVKAIDEFIRLLKDRFYQRAVDIFCGTTNSRRAVILSKMETVPLAIRKAFAKSVYDCGLDVEVPGVKDTGSRRPW
jgi:hypothetical protein